MAYPSEDIIDIFKRIGKEFELITNWLKNLTEEVVEIRKILEKSTR